MSKNKSIPRHRARKLALQAIYQWQFDQTVLTDEIELQFHKENDMSRVDLDYFTELLHQVPKNIKQIDTYLEKVVDRPLAKLSLVELAVLRIATYELIYRHDVPYKVAINEALRVNQTFGTQEGFRYVNGVLDKLAPELRPQEVSAHLRRLQDTREDS